MNNSRVGARITTTHPSILFRPPKLALKGLGGHRAIMRGDDCMVPWSGASQYLAGVPGRRSRVQDELFSAGPQIGTGEQAGVETPQKGTLKRGRRDSKAHSFMIAV